MKVHLPGRGRFIRSHILQSLFERGHQVVNGLFDADIVIDVRGPSRPQDFIDGKIDLTSAVKDFVNGLELNQAFKRPYLLLSSTDVEHNNNPYTAWKLGQEAALRAFATCYDFHATVIRTSCVFGPDMDTRRFIPLAAKLINEGKPVPIHVNGSDVSRRQWTYAPALADWLVDFATGTPIHVQTYVNWTLNAFDMAEAIALALDKPLITVNTEFYRNNPGHYPELSGSSDTKEHPPLLSLRVALRRTLYSLGLIHA